MEQKRVSYKVAKAINEAGYPQKGHVFYVRHGEELIDCPKYIELENAIYAPTYFDVWLWLWRKKDMRIKDTHDGAVWVWIGNESHRYIEVGTKDPEEAIIATIDYLVDNNLIK